MQVWSCTLRMMTAEWKVMDPKLTADGEQASPGELEAGRFTTTLGKGKEKEGRELGTVAKRRAAEETGNMWPTTYSHLRRGEVLSKTLRNPCFLNWKDSLPNTSLWSEKADAFFKSINHNHRII